MPIPQAELHCHLIGVIDRALLTRVRAAGHPTLVEPEAVRAASDVVSAATFLDYLQSLAPYARADTAAFLPILTAHLDDLIAQGVGYTELIVSPTMLPADRDQALAALAAFVAAGRTHAAGRIETVLLAILPRRLPEAAMARDTDLLIAARAAGLIAGVAVAGLDYDLGLARLMPMLTRLKDAGLGIEIHTGEHTPPEEVAFVLDSGLADRIGHGIRAFEDAALVRRLARAGVHLEFCPSSNVATGVVARIADLPVRHALDAGVPFSINSDDPGAFGYPLTSEIAAVAHAFALDAATLAHIRADTYRARFSR